MSIFKANTNIILASNSPRRQQFLKDIDLSFQILLPSSYIEEIDANIKPYENAMLIAKGKALAVKSEYNISDSLIISSDTIVVLNNEAENAKILGKPKDIEEAFAMLKLLNNNKHTVITAVCFILPNTKNNKVELFYDKTDVYFANWSDETLKKYALTEEGLDKAGAYAVQGIGTFLVEKLDGAYSTVVGFPVHLCIEKLKEFGMIS